MEASSRRQWTLLGALVVILMLALWWNLGTSPAPPPTPAAGGRPAPARGRAPAPERLVVDDVDIEALDAERPHPASTERNPFRFEDPTARRTARAPEDLGTVLPVPGVAGGDPGALTAAPPPMESIPLRFIGVVSRTEQQRRLAVLTDGRNVFYGREGDIIEGRYRIVRIGVESIEVAYVDGRAQQTLRMSGS